VISANSNIIDYIYEKFGKITLGYDPDMMANDRAGRYKRTTRRAHYRFDKKRLWVKQDGLCYWCGKQCVFEGLGGDWNQFTVDHVIPLGYNGTNHWMNLVGVCHKCNNKRGKRWQDYRMVPLLHLDKEEILVWDNLNVEEQRELRLMLFTMDRKQGYEKNRR
jgi:CRISPR/Cas system Type II protein with McrA/HNH and RuvC-like nuclease domain